MVKFSIYLNKCVFVMRTNVTYETTDAKTIKDLQKRSSFETVRRGGGGGGGKGVQSQVVVGWYSDFCLLHRLGLFLGFRI